MSLKLLDERLLWQQLDGPQANAIMEGGRGWFKSWLVPLLQYFRNWSIDTAQGKHLDLIGNIMGLGRPVIVTDFYFEQALKFHDAPVTEEVHDGFGTDPTQTLDPSNPNSVVDGGVFDYVRESDRPINTMQDMSDTDYRAMLKTLSSGPGELGSYLFVDGICHAFAGTDYEISSAYGVFADARPEDILIHLTRYMTRPFIAIEAIMRMYVTPFPRVYVNMVGGG